MQKQTFQIRLPSPPLIDGATPLPHVATLLPARTPMYHTSLGAAYQGDARALLAELPDRSVNLVVTSPPYALHFKKEYGNVDKESYVNWFRPFGEQILRALTDDGSFVLNIGGSYNAGSPTRSLYHFKLLIMLCDELGFRLAQECFWYNPAKLPTPAEWVNVRRMRIKDSVEYIWWLSKGDWPKADNTRVLTDYSEDMRRLIRRGFRATQRPSGHMITPKFGKDRGGSIPSNVLYEQLPENVIARGNNESNSEYIRALNDAGEKPHPARFPRALPEFFIKLLTEPGDVVLDPFAGSNMTGFVADELERRWLACDLETRYVESSMVRFNGRLTSLADDAPHA